MDLVPKDYKERLASYSAIFEILKENWTDFYEARNPRNKRLRPLVKDKYIEPHLENGRFLISEIMHRLFPKGVYLEIGVHIGCSLISVAIGAPQARCIGIDHLNQWNEDGKNEERLNFYLDKYRRQFGLNNIEFIKKDGLTGIRELFREEPSLKVDLLYYDADHKCGSQLEIMEAVVPHMNKKCVICVDDILQRGITPANTLFVRTNPGFSLPFNIIGAGWGHGLGIMVRGKIE